MKNPPKSRLFAIGDIHGHYTEFISLMHQLVDKGMVGKRDTIVFLGDYIDGGPDTNRVVNQLISFERVFPHWVFLLGNHEDLMTDALGDKHIYHSFDLWYQQGGKETALSYLPAELNDYEKATAQIEDFIPQSHIDWLKSRPLFHQTDDFYFVHAGLNPNVPVDAQSRDDLLWIREEFYNARHNFGKPVVFGHSAFNKARVFRPLTEEGVPDASQRITAIGIDTARHNAGSLTAVELTDPTSPVFYTQPIKEVKNGKEKD